MKDYTIEQTYTIDELAEMTFRLSEIRIRTVKKSQGVHGVCNFISISICYGNSATLILDKCDEGGYFNQEDHDLNGVDYHSYGGEQFIEGRKDIEGKGLVDSLIFNGESKNVSDYREYPLRIRLYMKYEQFLRNHFAHHLFMRSSFNSPD